MTSAAAAVAAHAATATAAATGQHTRHYHQCLNKQHNTLP